MSRWQVLSLDRVRLTAAPAVDFDFRHGPRSVCTTHCPRGRGGDGRHGDARRASTAARGGDFRVGSGCAGGSMLRGSSLVDHVLEDDPSAPPLLRPENASAPATVTPGDNADRTPGVGEDGCTFDPPTAANPANDLDFCPGVGGGARCPDSKPSRCAPGCEDRGTCNQELGRCDCPRGMGGDACELGQLERFEVPETHRDDPPLCYNDCSGRGECVEGFCRCLPGFFGSDCAVYLDDAGAPRLAPDTPGAVTVPLPRCTCTICPRFNQHFDTRKLDRPTEILFFERVCRASPNGRIPTTRISSSCTSRLGSSRGRGKALYIDAIKYVDETWPERTRRNGLARPPILLRRGLGTVRFFRNARAPSATGGPTRSSTASSCRTGASRSVGRSIRAVVLAFIPRRTCCFLPYRVPTASICTPRFRPSRWRLPRGTNRPRCGRVRSETRPRRPARRTAVARWPSTGSLRTSTVRWWRPPTRS